MDGKQYASQVQNEAILIGGASESSKRKPVRFQMPPSQTKMLCMRFAFSFKLIFITCMLYLNLQNNEVSESNSGILQDQPKYLGGNHSLWVRQLVYTVIVIHIDYNLVFKFQSWFRKCSLTLLSFTLPLVEVKSVTILNKH